jgi:hypothetical protein
MSTISELSSGQYMNDKRNGKGTYCYCNGNKYTGDWVDGNMTGQAVFTWFDGDRYEMSYIQMSSHRLL